MTTARDDTADYFATLRATWEHEADQLRAELARREAPLRELFAAIEAATRLDPPPIAWPALVDHDALGAWRGSSGRSLRSRRRRRS